MKRTVYENKLQFVGRSKIKIHKQYFTEKTNVHAFILYKTFSVYRWSHWRNTAAFLRLTGRQDLTSTSMRLRRSSSASLKRTSSLRVTMVICTRTCVGEGDWRNMRLVASSSRLSMPSYTATKAVLFCVISSCANSSSKTLKGEENSLSLYHLLNNCSCLFLAVFIYLCQFFFSSQIFYY